ncbi:MAG: TIGR04255 family protein [Planctomycetes bacterium]|nr:TIGR04255 family protein [Planctomycetota bacterium]
MERRRRTSRPSWFHSRLHYGEFRELVKGEYPNTEDRMPIADLFENRKVPTIPETLEVPPLRRVFYIDASGNFLLQLQPSRFLANWRRMRAEDEYPRFGAAYKRFLTGWDLFLRFARDRGLGTPMANQYELTYINHIVAMEAGFPAGIESFMPLFSWSAARSLRFLPPPLGLAMRLRFPLPENSGVLHLKVDHGRRQHDDKEILVLEFTARGPAAPDWSDMKRWFGIAHEQIVNGFTDLTSPAAHRQWGILSEKP